MVFTYTMQFKVFVDNMCIMVLLFENIKDHLMRLEFQSLFDIVLFLHFGIPIHIEYGF